MLITLLKGILIGAAISAPLGPVGLLCIRETVYGSRQEGLLTGLGAMLSDVLYCYILYLGVGLILEFVAAYDLVFRILGGVIIFVFSYILYRNSSRPLRQEPTRRLSKKHGLRKVLTAFLVTLSNPFIMLLILPLYARTHFVQHTGDPLHTFVAMSGIALGCMLWWYFLTHILTWLSKRTGDRSVKVISRSVALVLAVVGLVGVVSGSIDALHGRNRSAQLLERNTSSPAQPLEIHF